MILPAAFQFPLFQFASMTAMTFCINTAGMELMIALKRMQAMVTGSMTG